MDSKLQQEREVNGGTPFAEARGSAWSKAQIHFDMAKAAMKLANRGNDAGAIMAAEHLERAAASLRATTPNEKGQP